jgi:hypothetical protein
VIIQILESEKLLPDLKTLENIHIQKSIVNGLFGITQNTELKLPIEVKTELVSFLNKILIRCQVESTAGESFKSTPISELQGSVMGILLNMIRTDFQFCDVPSDSLTVHLDRPACDTPLQPAGLALPRTAARLHEGTSQRR